jgi:hypothetical protein
MGGSMRAEHIIELRPNANLWLKRAQELENKGLVVG